jgi:hypothetical protein
LDELFMGWVLPGASGRGWGSAAFVERGFASTQAVQARASKAIKLRILTLD